MNRDHLELYLCPEHGMAEHYLTVNRPTESEGETEDVETCAAFVGGGSCGNLVSGPYRLEARRV